MGPYTLDGNNQSVPVLKIIRCARILREIQVGKVLIRTPSSDIVAGQPCRAQQPKMGRTGGSLFPKAGAPS